ncbi:hypothetical protein PPL_04392 [Heterostelium album PN500]|uniref:Uncharacterized protein n=1 Tax=Heterostelium pallidum (strain ATCC 26659 / Pp 5 / PN500) TaxID=670386 RepID=D3B7F4_HETP5|nr:hypothetical protein PPL_04392 [Heterostelium album PN500]EFA82697.1 hypothetical protein PPL_04392 [Heterostelium album PN500]|eukprot:XP_020434814.1 hypothetical protein PPL_04392 [Heterostelium album PN500]
MLSLILPLISITTILVNNLYQLYTTATTRYYKSATTRHSPLYSTLLIVLPKLKSVQPPVANNQQQQQQQQQQRDNLTNKPYCFTCGKEFGIFTSKIACDLCFISFCLPCITKLSSKDITGVLREGQTKNYCSGCVFIVKREESSRRHEAMLQQARDDPLYQTYCEITLVKKAIHAGMPSFEYLASSVTDFTRASSKNKETFIINLPKFKTIQNQILHLEMNTATNIYTVLCRNAIDNQLNREFWDKYQVPFQNAIRICRSDLFNATVRCGEDWEKHKNLVDKSICQTDSSFLGLADHPSKEFEATLIRKNAELIKKMMEQITMRVKPDELVQSKAVLNELHQLLTNAYNKGLQF